MPTNPVPLNQRSMAQFEEMARAEFAATETERLVRAAEIRETYRKPPESALRLERERELER